MGEVQVYTALGSVAITAAVTLLTVYVTNRHNMKRMHLQFEHEKATRRSEQHRQRLEEVYVLAEKFVTQLSTHWMLLMQVMKGDLTYNQALDIANDRTDDPVYDRLEMLVDLYFPDLHLPMEKIIECRKRANEIILTHKKQYKAGDIDGMRYVEPMREITLQLDKAGKKFKQVVVQVERGI